MSNSDYLSDDYDPYGSPQNQPRRSGPNWTLILLILGGVGLLCIALCCGGGFYLFKFGTDVIAEQILVEIEDNPVIVEHIGTINEFEVDMAKSAAVPGGDVLVLRISGDKGSGYLTVESTSIGADREEVIDGTLKMDSGEEFALFEESGGEASDDVEDGLGVKDEIGEAATDEGDAGAIDGSDAGEEGASE